MITKVFHNALFDTRFLKATCLVETQEVECTKTMMKILHPEISSGLGSTIETIIGDKIDKEISHKDWEAKKLSDRQIEYAVLDVLYLVDIYNLLWSELFHIKVNQDRSHFYKEIMDAILLKGYIEVEGYTDLFDYQQTPEKTTKRYREWWNKLNK